MERARLRRFDSDSGSDEWLARRSIATCKCRPRPWLFELCTAAYAEATLRARGIHGEGAARANHELRRLREGAALAAQYGLHVAAGHGLTVRNVGAVAEISEVEEFNIGHSIISQAVFIGLERSVRAMRKAIAEASI